MEKSPKKSAATEIIVRLEPWEPHLASELAIELRTKAEPKLQVDQARPDLYGRATLRIKRDSPFDKYLRSPEGVVVRVIDRKGKQLDTQQVTAADDALPIGVKLHLASGTIKRWRVVRPATVRRLADQVARLHSVKPEEARAPRPVIAAIEELNEVGQLAASILDGQKAHVNVLRDRLHAETARSPGGAPQIGVKAAMAGLGAMGKVWASEFPGFRCDPAVGRAMDIMKAGFALDVRDDHRTASWTAQARAFAGSRLRTMHEFLGSTQRAVGGHGDGMPQIPEGEHWVPILPDDIPQDLPEPDPPPGTGDICEQVTDLCMSLYEASANAALQERDPNRTLIQTVEPNCLAYNYDPDQIFTARPAQGQSFTTPRPPEFRLYFRNQNIVGSVETYSGSEITFKIPPALHNLSGFVSLTDLSVMPASGQAIDPGLFNRLCGISLPEVPTSRPPAIPERSYISVIFPPAIDLLSATSIEEEWPAAQCTAPMKLCWRAHLLDQPVSSPLIACGSIEVDIFDESRRKIVADGSPSGCVRINASGKQVYTAEARSFASGAPVGRAVQTLIVRPVHHMRLVSEQPAAAEAEIRAGDTGRFRIEVSCPPEADVQIALVSNHPEVLQVPASVTLQAGANKVSVEFTTRTGQQCWPIKVTASAPPNYLSAAISYEVFQVPSIEWRYLPPYVRAFWGFSEIVTTDCLPEDAGRNSLASHV